MNKRKLIKISIGTLLILFLTVGVPVIINECYKVGFGYSTIWSGTDILNYYGSILGSGIAVIALIITIVFTRLQIQRESYLKTEKEKWDKIENIIASMLDEMNPIRISMKTIHIGFSDPVQAIQALQKYQLNCKIASDQLSAYLNVKDYQKVKKLIDSIINASGEFVQISQSQIDQYSNLKDLGNRNIAEETIKNNAEHVGSFTEQELDECKRIISNSSNINYSDIKTELFNLADGVVKLYEKTYIPLLKLKGATFETINTEIQQYADDILHLRRK